MRGRRNVAYFLPPKAPRCGSLGGGHKGPFGRTLPPSACARWCRDGGRAAVWRDRRRRATGGAGGRRSDPLSCPELLRQSASLLSGSTLFSLPLTHFVPPPPRAAKQQIVSGGPDVDTFLQVLHETTPEFCFIRPHPESSNSRAAPFRRFLYALV